VREKCDVASTAEGPTATLAVSCSESPLLSVFLKLLDPSCVIQTLGGTLPAEPSHTDLSNPREDSEWGTIAYAIDQLALRRIVLCGYSRCCLPAM
jgi:hypothetical protein